MKHIILFVCLMATTTGAFAQENDNDTDTKKKNSISIGSEGLKVSINEEAEREAFDIHVGMVDFGVNYLSDKTNYNDPAVLQYLNVSPELQNENLFSMRSGKSINVNIYPVLASYRLLSTKRQRIYIAAGVGLQLYNFRFTKGTTYINETVPEVVMDTIGLKKNKLGFTFLSVPLMLNFKTKLAKDAWLVYGVGITGGYRIASWTKQVSDERGKQKNHDQFNFNNFNSCVTAEFGVDGYFRLYASYQVTPLHKDIMDQYPYCIGVRFLGI